MKDLQVADKHYQLPSEWNELSMPALKELARLTPLTTNPAEIKLKITLKSLGWTIAKKRPVFHSQKFMYKVKLSAKEKPVNMSSLDLSFISTAFDFLFLKKEDEKTGNLTYILNSCLTKNPFQSLVFSGNTWIGPADGLTNITYEEYIRAEVSYDAFGKTGEGIYLDRLIASLWREKDTKSDPSSHDYRGDQRIPFNDNVLEATAKHASQINVYTRYLMLLFYQGCQNYIRHCFPLVFSAVQNEKHFTAGLPQDLFSAYMQLTDSLSDGDVTKNDSVLKTPLFVVLYRLEHARKQYEEMKEKNKPKKNGKNGF